MQFEFLGHYKVFLLLNFDIFFNEGNVPNARRSE
jgi:hypothetical protein